MSDSSKDFWLSLIVVACLVFGVNFVVEDGWVGVVGGGLLGLSVGFTDRWIDHKIKVATRKRRY